MSARDVLVRVVNHAAPGHQGRDVSRSAVPRLLAISACGLLAACVGAGPSQPPTPTAAAPTAAAPSPTSRPTPTAAPANPTPIPTLPFTFVPAADAPDDAITVTLTGSCADCPVPVFVPSELTVPAGTLRIFAKNVPTDFEVSHNLIIGPRMPSSYPDRGDVLAETPILRTNEAGVLTVYGLAPGTYAMWCSVSGGMGPHWALGMQGTLTVTP